MQSELLEVIASDTTEVPMAGVGELTGEAHNWDAN